VGWQMSLARLKNKVGKRMSLYRFRFFNRDGFLYETPHEYADDVDALDAAKVLGKNFSIEIWKDARRVARVKLYDAPADFGMPSPAKLAGKGRPLKRVVRWGPDGYQLTNGDLPSSDLNHWLPRHKAKIVAAVRGGLISADQVCKRYRLSLEEFMIWEQALDSQGVDGLRVTRIQRDSGRRLPTLPG
jgi:hypothetical protein